MNNFIEVMAIVEGRTEQAFIERVLAPYLANKNIFIRATQISKPGQKGGARLNLTSPPFYPNQVKREGMLNLTEPKKI